jgi:pilus assembly protein CpaB
MKSTRALVMIVISFLVAVGAVLIASQWIKQQPTLSTRHIAVAATDIDIGARLTTAMVRIVEWPAGSIPAGAYDSDKDLVDRVVRTSIQRGEPLLDAKLAPLGTKGGLSAIVAEGKRAITVRVNDVVGVAGFALPGNYVDILVNTQEEGTGGAGSNQDRSVSKIVLEHILVLAVAQEAGRDETKPKVVNAVTLEVTPEEAEKLDLARSVGTLSLVLRNQVDPKEAETKGATKATLLGKAKPPPPPAPAVKPAVTVKARPRPAPVVAAAPPQVCVSVVTGTEVTRECF